MDRLDKDPNVIWWASEETVIGYRCPTDRKAHRYFVDFTVRVRQPDGKEKTLLIEVKPKSQTKPPVKTKGKHRRTYINEVMTYGKNTAKWKAAEEYCKDRGWDFIIMTESELGIV